MAWISQYGNIVFFFGQILFWLLIAGSAVFAALQFKRYVDFQMGVSSGKDTDNAEADDAATAPKDGEEPIKIEDFVE